MRQHKKQGRVEISGILLIIIYLPFKVIPRIVERMDFINPERSLIKGVKSQNEADDEAEQDQNQFPSFRCVYLS
jgi:hypothetical protein